MADFGSAWAKLNRAAEHYEAFQAVLLRGRAGGNDMASVTPLGRLVLIVPLAAALSCCGGPGPAGVAITATPAPRPTALPAYNGCHCYTGPPLGTPNAGCDSATRQLSFANPPDSPAVKLPHTVLGTGPVYWGGQDVWNVAGNQGAVVVNPSVTTAVTVSFRGPAGEVGTLDGNQQIIIGPRTDGFWAYAMGNFVASAPGCWSMTAVFGGTTVLVHFTAVAGPTEPG